ncbi:MAG TPA: HAMP domain-containing sensor histidine kinase [Bryobacteraceae bacterium]
MFRGTLRTKFLLSLVLISVLLTSATLLLVRQRVQVHARDEIVQGLRDSTATFRSFEQQRESTLERSAALLASLPPLKAVMTSQDPATILDASRTFWDLSGSQLFVLADRSGKLMATHGSKPCFTEADAQASMLRSLALSDARDWWPGQGCLFQVFLQPVYFGGRDENTQIGVLAVGWEIDNQVAADVSRVASSRVAFRYEKNVVVSTVSAAQREDLARQSAQLSAVEGEPEELALGQEQFLATSVRLSPPGSPDVSLTVLESYDHATAFLRSLNRWIVAVGIAAVLAGSVLVFFVSTTFTRPLAELVAGVHALESGDFQYPLKVRGSDEVSELTAAFHRMRVRLQESQKQLLSSERLATIGRMASTISHDLRHPLTAILAYAEFLSEADLNDAKRKDFYQEIRIAVNRMTDELNSLLGFSKEQKPLRPGFGRFSEIIERAIQGVRVLPEFVSIEITVSMEGDCTGWFDAGKAERVFLNLLYNACEAVPHDSGKIAVSCRTTGQGTEIRVADNGPGIPVAIRDTLFQPFVSSDKEQGIGLGLTVVQKLMQDHNGQVSVEGTGPEGTVFKLLFPATTPAQSPPQNPPQNQVPLGA